MSESSSETVPVVLAEEQLLQLASAVATSLTAYFEAKEEKEEVTVVATAPVEVTVTENVPAEEPAPDEQEEDEVTASPDTVDGHSTAEVETQPVEETDPDGGTDTDTDAGTDMETEATGTESV